MVTAPGNKLLERIATAHGKTAAQVSLRYPVQQGIVVIPRTNTLARLAENFALFDFDLTDAEMREIHALSIATAACRLDLVAEVGLRQRSFPRTHA